MLRGVVTSECVSDSLYRNREVFMCEDDGFRRRVHIRMYQRLTISGIERCSCEKPIALGGVVTSGCVSDSPYREERCPCEKTVPLGGVVTSECISDSPYRE